MARKHAELLLLESIENLGIVGDIVRVKTGYARNYLLPMRLAQAPTPEKIEALREARARAQAEMAALRAARERIIAELAEVEITLVRSCNDQGVLYGSVTQRDIADALQEAGHGVNDRAVRLSQPLRRVGHYPVPIQFERELRAEITVTIDPDQPLEEREEMEFDNEGNLIEKSPADRARERAAREASRAAARESAAAAAAAETETAEPDA